MRLLDSRGCSESRGVVVNRVTATPALARRIDRNQKSSTVRLGVWWDGGPEKEVFSAPKQPVIDEGEWLAHVVR